MITLMKLCDFDKMYQIMSQSFPPDEFRPYDEQKALLDNPLYSEYTLIDGDEMKAFIAVWNFDSFMYVEHFAVNPMHRNGGLGSQILSEIKSVFQKNVCLEVEPPENDVSRRRIEFYKRNGFYLNDYPYIQPAISKGKNPVPLMLMTTECGLNEKELDNIKYELYKRVYKVY